LERAKTHNLEENIPTKQATQLSVRTTTER
jgi:hypothetical protein